MVSLDGGNRVVGTEFIKLLNTGSSDLATVEYVNEQVALGGGSGDGYTQAEVDALLNNKLNVNNPQDIIGTLRIDSTNGNGKLIVNAVGAPNDEDFYVNGLSNLGGTLKCTLLQASSNIETSQLIKSNTINTYANVNMTIQRNSIDYIVLESDKVNFTKDIYVNDVLLTGGGDGTFDENVVINNPYELQCNTFNNNGLNQDVVFNINSGEWLRLQFSDNTVRVPNTKSFLSQEIYFNNIRPLAFSDDVVFYGGNQANNAYTEYFRNNRATETVDFNKVVKCSESLVMTISKEIILDNTSGKKRLIRAREDGAQSVIEISNERSTNNQIRLLNAGSTSMIVDNTNVYTPRQMQGDNGCKVDFLDTRNSGADFIFRRNNIEFFRLDTALDNIVCSKGIVAGGGIKCNTLDSDGDSDVIYKRNNVQFLALDKFTEDTVEKEAIVCSKQLRANSNILVQNLQINQFPVGIEYADFRLENADSVMRFYAGNSTSVNLQITNNDITLGRVASCNGGLKTNTINTNGDNNLLLQRNSSTYLTFNTDKVEISQPLHLANELVLDTSDLLKMKGQLESGDYIFDIRNDQALNSMIRFRIGGGGASSIIMQVKGTEVVVSQDLVMASTKSVKTNIIDTTTDTDLSFRRNGVEFFNFLSSVGVDNNDIINVAEGKGISAQHVYGNLFKSRSLGFDTIFYGSNTGATARVEYMRYNYAGESLDFNTVIDNTGLQVVGNIVDTTVSDERLKTNIKDVECNFTECVKNVKVKTFEYTDEKYKKNDRYGFIAQELLENLPKEFNHIVKENKEKDSDDKYLSINYMKVNLLLWGALQEEMAKTEYLESKLFETIARVEALEKPKKRTTTKTTT